MSPVPVGVTHLISVLFEILEAPRGAEAYHELSVVRLGFTNLGLQSFQGRACACRMVEALRLCFTWFCTCRDIFYLGLASAPTNNKSGRSYYANLSP